LTDQAELERFTAGNSSVKAIECIALSLNGMRPLLFSLEALDNPKLKSTG
jgi:hypothetical protein